MGKKQAFQWDSMTMGTCYYPEHWDESLWESDLDRMLRVGISTIRIGEFAWNKFEPEEGRFTYDFFDRFLELCEKKGMKVIFGTPTATPPAWLTEKYPEVLNARQDGVLYRHGGRRHYNYNSPKYQELCARIVDKIAAHIGRHPSIVGWQIDNELNCEIGEFYSEADDRAFRVFLQKKYGGIDRLNQAWGAVFWNQTYTDWGEVHLPRTLVGEQQNPHQILDYNRFVSDSVLRFCQMQSAVLRRHIPERVFITTNGRFGHMDNHYQSGGGSCLGRLGRAAAGNRPVQRRPDGAGRDEGSGPLPGRLLRRGVGADGKAAGQGPCAPFRRGVYPGQRPAAAGLYRRAGAVWAKPHNPTEDGRKPGLFFGANAGKRFFGTVFLGRKVWYHVHRRTAEAG